MVSLSSMVSIKSEKRRVSALILSRKFIATLITSLAFSPFIFYSILSGKKKADGIFVISLQGSPSADKRNQGRLDAFKEKWAQSCGSAPQIHHCPGAYDVRRGYGLTKSWLLCLERAKAMDLEVTVIFEDDARLFERAESLSFCDAEKRRNLLWSGLPEDTFLAFLGGHSWKYSNTGEDTNTTNSFPAKPVPFRETSFSYGTYGFAVPRQSLDLLLETIRGDIAHGFLDENGKRHLDFLSPEKSWYRTAHNLGKKIYAIHPLAVWHEGGFSNTWKKNRGTITGEEGDNNVGGIRGVRH